MPRGGPRPNAGRPKGRQSRITPAKKAFLREWIDGTTEEAQRIWSQIENPTDKLKIWLTAAEFAHPKLGRTEHVGDGGGPVRIIASSQDENL